MPPRKTRNPITNQAVDRRVPGLGPGGSAPGRLLQPRAPADHAGERARLRALQLDRPGAGQARVLQWDGPLLRRVRCNARGCGEDVGHHEGYVAIPALRMHANAVGY